MNQHSGDLKSSILAAAKRPGGATTADIHGYERQQVADMAGKLARKGLIYRGKAGHRTLRFFDTQAAAEAFASAAKPGVSIRNRLVPHSAWEGVECVIDEDMIQRLPAPPEHRFVVQPDEVPPCFSSLRPGQYLDAQPKPWVEAVAA